MLIRTYVVDYSGINKAKGRTIVTPPQILCEEKHAAKTEQHYENASNDPIEV